MTAVAAVPQAAPTRLSAAEHDAVHGAVHDVISSERWILGPSVERFEHAFAEYLGFGECVGVANGTDALAIAFCALDLPPGSSVLVAANEGGYAAIACRLAGLVPVVIDIDELTMLPTVETASTAMTHSVRAIVITRLHGESDDIAELDAWRRQLGLLLIEDCAQAAGAGGVGARADAATFSFYPTKNLATLGDAGAIVFADSTAASAARALRQYGWGDRFRAELARGRNSRMDSIHAAVLSARLPFLDERNARRREISGRYRAALDPRHARMHGDPHATVAHHSVVVTAHRDSLVAALSAQGIETAVHYPFLDSEMPGVDASEPPGGVPVAAAVRDRILSLPCFPELDETEIVRTVEALELWSDSID